MDRAYWGSVEEDMSVEPMPNQELKALCKRFVREGYNGDYVENDGYDLAREVERITIERCKGSRIPPSDILEPAGV